MYMSPDSYHHITKKFRIVKEVAGAYFEGKNSDGTILPMYFKEEIDELKKEISMNIGMCDMSQKCVNNQKRKATYRNMMDELNCYLDKLNNL